MDYVNKLNKDGDKYNLYMQPYLKAFLCMNFFKPKYISSNFLSLFVILRKINENNSRVKKIIKFIRSFANFIILFRKIFL